MNAATTLTAAFSFFCWTVATLLVGWALGGRARGRQGAYRRHRVESGRRR